MALTLESIVADKAMALKFRAYLIRRHNNENFSFWVEVHEFKIATPEKKVNKRVKEIFKKYFTPDSPYELNLGSDVTDQVKANMKKKPRTKELFDKALHSIKVHMEMEVVPEFRRSADAFADVGAELVGMERDRSSTVWMIDTVAQQIQGQH